MNIDFVKLLKLILPTFMRSGIDSIVKAIASQFTSLYTDFQLWQIDIRLQAAMTCQVMYMETILNYRLLNSFLRIIYITDGDGVSVDFIVNVPSGVNVDNYRLIALIEKYKASGKRYTIGQSAFTYEIDWSNMVCELATITYPALWSGFVCELDPRQTNFCQGGVGTLNSINGNKYYVGVYMQYKCASELTCVVSTNMGNLTVVVPVNTDGHGILGQLEVSQPRTYANIISITPSSDSVYKYTF